MDPRPPPPHQPPPPPSSQHQHGVPFARNPSSPPYGRSPFPPAAAANNNNNSSYPPASHPPSHPTSASPAAYGPDHQRRPSADAPTYFPHHHQPQQSRMPFGPGPGSDPASHPGPSHSRHQSSSSIGAGPLGRKMGPPSPPPQQQMGHYGMPPAPRAPPPSIGPPAAFPSARELPALNSIPRTGSTGGSMSIAGMLGAGLGAAPREPTPGSHPSAHAAPYPPPSTTPGSAGPGPAYAGSIHASPRMQHAAADFGPYSRRPQTPTDHARPYDARDQRGSAAGSPPQAVYGTPEVLRYGTPQAHPGRGPPLGPADDRRDQSGRMSAGSLPPRPSSQPRAYHGPGRSLDMGRGPPPGEPFYGPRREELRPGQAEYNPEGPPRGIPYDEQRRLMDRDREYRERIERDAELRERDRISRARFEEEQHRLHHQRPPFMSERERMEQMERERMERDREFEMRERERRERTSSDPSRHGGRPGDFGPQGGPGSQGPPPYGRDPRDAAPGWQLRPGFEQPPPRPYDQIYGPRPGPNEHPASAAPQYGGYPAHSQPPPDRYPPGGPPPPHAVPVSQPGPGAPQPYESPDRHRFAHLPPHHHQQHQPPHRGRPGDEGPPPPSVAYNGGSAAHLAESSRPARPNDDGGPTPPLARQQSGGFLAIGEINRKGRVSPLPQAVQGAQPQSVTPAAEPGIKSEFGRMFSGIGSGASAFGVSSPAPSHLPFTNAGLARRDDAEAPSEPAAPEPPAKPARKRNRKTKDEDSKGDDDSSGRLTPVGRTKRARTNHAHHHHHQYVTTDYSIRQSQYTNMATSSHHHHHHHVPERTASPLHPNNTPLKNMKSSTPGHSPTGLPLTHNHQIPRSTNNTAGAAAARQRVQSPTIVPKPKRTISSQRVLDSCAHKPRKHLGDVVYSVSLSKEKFTTHSKDGYRSNPKPLPMDLIKDNENSTLTVKVPRANLDPTAREEITKRCAVWGTDVYTDDSDVIAACIHSGWFRGEWGSDVDVALLELDKPTPKSKRGGATAIEKKPQDVLQAPPTTGPMHVPPNRDLHVTILILPSLDIYRGTTMHGLRSRDWGGSSHGRRITHDGLSFKIMEVRWVDGAAPQSRLRGKARRERIRKAMSEVHRSQVIDLSGPKKTEPQVSQTTPAVNGDGDKENRPATKGTPAVDSGKKDGAWAFVQKNGPVEITTPTQATQAVREPSENDAQPMDTDDVARVEAKTATVA
ncbi:uncharacterized protein JN550_011800 [Neoarthrinium moseri]|uniref:uncharacterized protein n=1 Tax=Neoarthrinium moseri TaxID=1658444 RepID=UPI001FDCB2E4|nr:uncharacterized protein JN550_011800 [Neoarthrinium moseri]KAI1859881.1 hypothetical protein JN550_011800 [Neoarthrinium moseri]